LWFCVAFPAGAAGGCLHGTFLLWIERSCRYFESLLCLRRSCQNDVICFDEF
jgi:hypothetical protein